MARWVAMAGLVGVVGCGGRPAPPPPAAPAPAAPTWALFTDAGRVDRLEAQGGVLLALGAGGLGRWDVATGAYQADATAPTAGNALAEAADKTRYIGAGQGLWSRSATGAWSLLADPPLKAGVQDLAPRAAGGVWLALPGGVGYADQGQVRLLSTRHAGQDLTVEADGTVWLATRDRGVVQILADRLEEHTTEQGLCGAAVRAIVSDRAGRLVATCTGADDGLVAIRQGGTWTSYPLPGVERPVLGAWPAPAGIAIRSATSWWLLADAGPGTPVAPAGPLGPAPPLLDAPPPPPAAPASGEIVVPPPVPMPAPIVAPRVQATPLPVIRASAGPASARGGTRYLRPAPELAPAEGQVTAWAPGDDGSVYHAITGRGVVGRRGEQQRRYAAGGLLAPAPTRLVVDGEGEALAVTADGRLLRSGPGGFQAQRVGADPALRVLAVGLDAGRALVLGLLPGEPAPPPPPVDIPRSRDDVVEPPPPPPPGPPGPGTLVVLRATEGGYAELARVSLPPRLAGRLRVGTVVAQGGEAWFSLFEGAGSLQAIGLGHLGAGYGTLTVTRPGDEGGVRLPDAWINDLALGPDGALLLATNAGLARFAGGETRVYDENDFLDSELMLAVAVAGSTPWVGTFEGLGRLGPEGYAPVRKRGLTGRILAVAPAPGGGVYVGTEAGLWRGDAEGPWRRVPVRGREDVGEVTGVAVGRDVLWIATSDGLLRTSPAP
ncbi:MAG: hypothetical protein H6706_03275 [Myxococcales bacterium]|nr:hypothetical protein [Myxococcales bacterium]